MLNKYYSKIIVNNKKIQEFTNDWGSHSPVNDSQMFIPVSNLDLHDAEAELWLAVSTSRHRFCGCWVLRKVNSSFFLQLCQHSVNVWITRSICGWMCAGIVPAVTATLFTSDHCRRNTTVSTATFYCVCVCVLMSQIVPRLAPGWQVELMLLGKSNQWSQ